MFVLALIEHHTRRSRVMGATAHPCASWVAQAARNLVMDLQDASCRARLERWVQTCRVELLNRTMIWNQHHLRALREFEAFYNHHRPHQGIANARPLLPLPPPITDRDACLDSPGAGRPCPAQAGA